jgi:rubrerythrin
MTVEGAIRTALEYEAKVRDVYEAAATEATDPVAARVLRVLAKEEQGHLDYLESRLAEWQATGKVTAASLGTVIPPAARLKAATIGLGERMALSDDDRASALATLRKAEAAERATAAFYQGVVGDLPGEAEKAMFARFVEIEVGHATIVQAEIDSLTGLGFWFDVPEFRLEEA